MDQRLIGSFIATRRKEQGYLQKDIAQLILNNSKVCGVIDWTCACRHPYIWEIVRSYVFMAPEVKQEIVGLQGVRNL